MFLFSFLNKQKKYNRRWNAIKKLLEKGGRSNWTKFPVYQKKTKQKEQPLGTTNVFIIIFMLNIFQLSSNDKKRMFVWREKNVQTFIVCIKKSKKHTKNSILILSRWLNYCINLHCNLQTEIFIYGYIFVHLKIFFMYGKLF